jgi:hypothetical protein
MKMQDKIADAARRARDDGDLVLHFHDWLLDWVSPVRPA